LRLDGIACARALAVLFILAFLFTQLPTVSAGGYQTDYVQYVIVEDSTFIEGTIVDNELGTPVGGAGVGGEVHSDIIYVNVQADANGHFKVNVPPGNHTYVLNISAPGYDNRTITGSFTVQSGERKNLGQIRINYNPFDVVLAENSGSLAREWSPYASGQVYEYRLTQELNGRKDYIVQLGGGSAQYTVATRGAWTSRGFPFTYYDSYRKQNVTFYSGHFDARDYNERVWVPWTYHGIWTGSNYTIGYDSSGRIIAAWDFKKYYTAANGSEIGLSSALRNVQYRINYLVADGHYGRRTARGLTTTGVMISMEEYPYWLHAQDIYIGVWLTGLAVPPQNFTITSGEYYSLVNNARYANFGSFVRTDTTNYSLAPWDSKQTTLTATPRNGYTGNVKLVLENDNGVDAILGSSELRFSSPAQTTLTLMPKENTHGSLHPVIVKAYDSNGRLVVGSVSKPAPAYDLSLTTPPKPDPLTVSYLLSSASSYISVLVQSQYTGALSGASVSLRYSNGALFTSGTTNSNGTVTFTPSLWPLNTHLQVTASYGGYFTGSSSVYTATGGVRSTSVTLNKGDFVMAGSRGYAEIYPNGTPKSNNPGSVTAGPAWNNGNPGWLGGYVTLTGQLNSTYFSDYNIAGLKSISVNPSGVQTINVSATPKQVLTTSCAVRVEGRAGAPTNYWKTADIGYDVKSAPY